MKNITLAITMMFAVASGSSSAEEVNVFRNPCERGPLPNVSMINHERDRFVSFLQSIRPEMPHNTAMFIAYQLCADMSLVGDSAGLTQHLNDLLSQNGY